MSFQDRFKNYITHNATDADCNINQVARANFVDRSTVYRIIKKEMGIPPSKLLQRERLQKSQQLLRENHLNISEVAYGSGFSDPSYFTRLFKDTLGLTPSQYRRKFR